MCSEITQRLSAGQTNEQNMSVSMPSILLATISNFDIDTYLKNFSKEISFSVTNNTVDEMRKIQRINYNHSATVSNVKPIFFHIGFNI